MTMPTQHASAYARACPSIEAPAHATNGRTNGRTYVDALLLGESLTKRFARENSKIIEARLISDPEQSSASTAPITGPHNSHRPLFIRSSSNQRLGNRPERVLPLRCVSVIAQGYAACPQLLHAACINTATRRTHARLVGAGRHHDNDRAAVQSRTGAHPRQLRSSANVPNNLNGSDYVLWQSGVGNAVSQASWTTMHARSLNFVACSPLAGWHGKVDGSNPLRPLANRPAASRGENDCDSRSIVAESAPKHSAEPVGSHPRTAPHIKRNGGAS